jgi:SAM-dependent methyltransferase
MGADVTVVDISADALATLRRRAADAAVGDRIHALQGDVEALAHHIAGRVFDLGLAHELLEAVDDPAAALQSIATAVRPGGGLVSVLVVNPIGQVLARVLAGDLVAARDELRRWAEGVHTGLDPAAVTWLCQQARLTVQQAHGIGVFAELLPGPDADPGMLSDLEELAAARPPYREIAARFHVIARRSAG